MAMLKPSLDDLLRSSLRSIWKNKGRTVLTSLGIIIGVTSVILLTSIGNGLKNYISSQFEQLGSNVIFVVPGKIFNDNGGFNNNDSSRLITTTFTQEDIKNLRRTIKGLEISPLTQTTIQIKRGNNLKNNISFVGTNEIYGKNANSVPQATNGRWFSKEENDKKSKVVVLGFGVADKLFPNQSALGKKVTIFGGNYQVIGIIDKKGSTFGGPSLDDHVYTPINTIQSVLGRNDIQSIYIKIPKQTEIKTTQKKIKKVLLEEYEEDAFSVFDSSQLLNSINTIIGTLTIALSGIAAISLLVGGIGIMNIMLVTVSERTREIGLRKAIGAYPRAILLQFIFEAIILSSIGGLIGFGLGLLGTLAINNFFPATITLGSVLLALGVSLSVGIIFGVAPARKASKLSPIEALRYE